MAFSMQSLAVNILLDSMQPMGRQSAKTVEANIHMLADRMMTIAADTRMISEDPAESWAGRNNVLQEAAEIYELHTIALYGTGHYDGDAGKGVRGNGHVCGWCV